MNAQELATECYKFENAARRIAQLELRKGGPRHLSPEDVVQDAFVKVLECWEEYDPELGSVKSWFLRIVANCCHLAKRQERGQAKRPREFVSLDELTEAAAGSGIGDPLLLACLTERQREVMALSLQGYSYGEIGEQLDLRRATVAEHLRQARRRLRKADQKEEVVRW